MELQASLEKREAQLTEAQKALSDGETALIKGWESLANEQQQFVEYTQREDVSKLHPSLESC